MNDARKLPTLMLTWELRVNYKAIAGALVVISTHPKPRELMQNILQREPLWLWLALIDHLSKTSQ